MKKLQNAILYDFSVLKINNGKKINPPKNQIFANRYFKDNMGSLEMNMFNANKINWRIKRITSGLLRYFFISVLLLINNTNHSAVDNINKGSAGVDKDKLPKEISIDIAKLASMA